MSHENEMNKNQQVPFDAFDDEFLKWFPIYYQRLMQESERGSAIVTAALMDNALKELLQAKLVPSPTKKDTLFDGFYSPLGNFSAKIDFAYRIGTIGQNMKSSLHLIRKIRNDFAHSTLNISFESASVQDRIKELFTLNRDLLEASSCITRKEVESTIKLLIDHPDIKQFMAENYQEEGVEYLVKIGGWKFTFNLLGALNAARLLAFHKTMKPLEAVG